MKIKNLFENANLNINLWLVAEVFMDGYLQDGRIYSNKYASFYQLMIVIMLINNIEFPILLLSPK